MYRRSKYVDLIMCFGCGLFFLYWYYSRRDITNRLMMKEEEKREAIAYMNSLKEELKIVFQHTQSLEVLLKNEKLNHQLHFKELQYKSRYDQFNISKFANEFEEKLLEKELTLQRDVKLNTELKSKHLELLHRIVRVRDDHTMLSHRSTSDLQSLGQSKEMVSLSLDDRIEDLESQKKYYQRQSVQYDYDMKKSAKKFEHCFKVLTLLQKPKQQHTSNKVKKYKLKNSHKTFKNDTFPPVLKLSKSNSSHRKHSKHNLIDASILKRKSKPAVKTLVAKSIISVSKDESIKKSSLEHRSMNDESDSLLHLHKDNVDTIGEESRTDKEIDTYI